MDENRMSAFAAAQEERLRDSRVIAGRRLVWGEGSARCALCLIGEAPGRQEAEQGRPFVGKAGENLNEFLRAAGLRREDLWITNTVKVRPAKVSEKGTVSNRPPNAEELALFLPLLAEELRLLRPPLVVTLGNTALRALMGRDAIIGAVHGRAVQCPMLEAPLFPLYHPASVIYNRALKEVYQSDLQRLKAYLEAHEPEGRNCLCD